MIGLLKKIKHSFSKKANTSICPVCCNSDITFIALPPFYKEQAEKHGYERFGQGEMISVDKYSCSSCGASDRERIYAYWIEKMLESGRLTKGMNLMHFAPEGALSAKIKSYDFFDYKTADLCMEGVDYNIDMMAMPFDDESVDFFICSHVLEHVASDDQAIKELYRITKSGGFGILVAPISVGLNKTLEDPNVTSEEERWKYYGQNDHLRLYGHDDYVTKIRSHGFKLDELGVEHFGENVFNQLGLTNTSILYIAHK